MQAVQHIQIPERLRVVVTLAHLLQRLEGSSVPVSPTQYHSVARRLANELDHVESDEALDAVLNTFPAAAQVYENLHYEQAGLCRMPLELSTSTELAARAAIKHAARH